MFAKFHIGYPEPNVILKPLYRTFIQFIHLVCYGKIDVFFLLCDTIFLERMY